MSVSLFVVFYSMNSSPHIKNQRAIRM